MNIVMDRPLIDRCLAVEDSRCTERPNDGQVLCVKHQGMRDAGANFGIAIVPLSEFNDFAEER
jgi:hypothetical protein